MTGPLITITKNPTIVRFELNLIGANARGLKGPGKDLLPLKRDMLVMPDNEASVVMDATELLFAAILQFVEAERAEDVAGSTIDYVTARIRRGQADGTIRALLHGSTRMLFEIACEHAPIAMHAIFEICPDLQLRDRLLSNLLNKQFR